MPPITSEKEGCNYEGACREAVFFSGGRSLINASSCNVHHHHGTLYISNYLQKYKLYKIDYLYSFFFFSFVGIFYSLISVIIYE